MIRKEGREWSIESVRDEGQAMIWFGPSLRKERRTDLDEPVFVSDWHPRPQFRGLIDALWLPASFSPKKRRVGYDHGAQLVHEDPTVKRELCAPDIDFVTLDRFIHSSE